MLLRPDLRRSFSRVLTATLACAAVTAAVVCGGDAADATAVTVDTLPGGIVRILSARPIEPGRWALAHARDVQPAELDPAELLEPRDLALADDGTVLISDTKPERIKVFDREGRLVRTIGGEGDGPGEHRVAYIALRGDTLVVQDPVNSRATTFDWRTGALLVERRTACCYWSPIGVSATGEVFARSIVSAPDTSLRNVQAYVRFPIGGSTVDTLFALERQDTPPRTSWELRDGDRMQMMLPVPFEPQAQFAIEPTGVHLTGWNGDYLLRTSRDGRDTIALFGRAATPVPVTAAEKRRIADVRVAEMRRGNPQGISEQVLRIAFDPALIPDRYPAYDSFTIDRAGRRWVRLTGPDTTHVSFDLFDAEGRWLDSLRLPATDWPAEAWRPVAWSRTEVAVFLEGEDGRPLVRVFSIVRK
jgi:6-bladed beta-propeller